MEFFFLYTKTVPYDLPVCVMNLDNNEGYRETKM